MKKNSSLLISINSILLVFLTLLGLLLWGCKEKSPTAENKAVIYCDQDFKYVMELQREVYEADAVNEKISIQYMSGESVLQNLLTGKAQVAIIGRSLTAQEVKTVLKVDSVYPKELLMAKDAVALVTGKAGSLQSLNYEQFLNDLKTGNSSYNLVFDSKQSGVVRSFDFLANANGKTLFALDSMDAVIDYVNAHDNAIGLLPYAKFSDEFNPEMKQLLTKIKIIPLEMIDSSGQKLRISASQSEIALNDYPLIRPINYIIANPKETASRNFINFLYKNRGAKVFLKAGLIPAIMPGRDIIIKNDAIDVKKE